MTPWPRRLTRPSIRMGGALAAIGVTSAVVLALSGWRQRRDVDHPGGPRSGDVDGRSEVRDGQELGPLAGAGQVRLQLHHSPLPVDPCKDRDNADTAGRG